MCPEASAQLVKSLVGVMQYTAPPQTPTATSLPPGSCEGGAVEGEHGKEGSNCSTTDRQPSSSSDRQLSSSASTSASHSLFESKLVSSCGGGGVAATVEQFSCSSALCWHKPLCPRRLLGSSAAYIAAYIAHTRKHGMQAHTLRF